MVNGAGLGADTIMVVVGPKSTVKFVKINIGGISGDLHGRRLSND